MSRQNITDHNAAELRERRNQAGGLSMFEKQAAMTDPFTTVHERLVLQGGGQGGAPSLAEASQGLRMPSAPSQGSGMEQVQINPSLNPDPGLPGVMPNREAMLGVLGPEGPRPHISNFQPTGLQPVSMPPVPGGSSGDAFQSGGHLTSFHGSGGGDMFSSIGSSPMFGQSSQSHSNAFENMASTLGEMNPGNLWNDVKRGVNPLLQFGKEVVKLVAGSVVAFVNFLFKPKTPSRK
jgi:hypothetical protein